MLFRFEALHSFHLIEAFQKERRAKGKIRIQDLRYAFANGGGPSGAARLGFFFSAALRGGGDVSMGVVAKARANDKLSGCSLALPEIGAKDGHRDARE